MMTPPLSIWARPRLAVQVPVSGAWPLVVGDVGAMGSTVMAATAPGVRTRYPYISSVCTDVRLKRIRRGPLAASAAGAREPLTNQRSGTNATHAAEGFGQPTRAVLEPLAPVLAFRQCVPQCLSTSS